MKLLTVFIATSVLFAAGVLSAGELKSPEEQFKDYPTRITDIPVGWSTTKPLRLQVCFNLKYPVNSPEANAFLKNLYDTITAMPFGVQVRIERQVFPASFAYCNSLTFRDWAVNRAYETSDVFLKYYREQWKPAVTETSEQLLVLDEVASASTVVASSSCSAPVHRQFDFWLGEWSVTQSGKPAGENRIISTSGGCALQESWKGQGGYAGVSLNFYDAKRARWKQIWMGADGGALHLEGGLTKDGAMRLEGETRLADGKPQFERITWTPIRDGQVRQLWEQRVGQDAPWKIAFDGIYVRTSQFSQ